MSFGKYFFLRSAMNGLVLDVEGGNTYPGTRIAMWHQKHDGNDNQLWYEEPISGTIRSKHTDFCIDVEGDSICIQPYSPGNPNQQWMVAGNRVQNRFNPSMNLDIAGNDGDAGARVCAWDYHGGDNQQWAAEYTAPRYFFIRSALNGKVLDIRGADSSPGTKVIMYDQNDGMSDNQMWYEDQHGIIRSKMNDFAIDASEGSMRMEPYDPGNSQQQWVIHGDRIVNRHNDQMCADIKGNDDSNGAKLCAYNAHGGDNQRWSIDFV